MPDSKTTTHDDDPQEPPDYDPERFPQPPGVRRPKEAGTSPTPTPTPAPVDAPTPDTHPAKPTPMPPGEGDSDTGEYQAVSN